MSERSTIDFGIDLGTTNSAIAVLKGVTTEVIKNNIDGDTTPSAVAITKRGDVSTGHQARQRMTDFPEDGFGEFKRRMGTQFEYLFKASGTRKRPEELSAEILKSLRGDAQQRCGEDLRAAVITVPAAFELHQCDATRKAAELAGLKGSPLLQEPVAAALAYGFQRDAHAAYWLVFDFGGGTFDAALIKAEDGDIHVVNHGGDNFLGGSDIDWAIIERVVAPRLAEEHDLPDFRRGNERWASAMRKLKRSVEQAKIGVSRQERAIVEMCRFEDDSGEEIDVDMPLARTEVSSVAEPIIMRAVEICRRVLKEKGLSENAVEKLILVGGPTLAPYFREVLQANLSIPIDFSVDPMTVVARGAAVFAGTQRLDGVVPKREAKAGEYSIDLKYAPIGSETDPDIGGRVSSSDGRSVEGYTIAFSNLDTGWSGGRIRLGGDGTFITTVIAEKGRLNTFAIELCDSTGGRQATIPKQFTYTVGAVAPEQPIIHSIGVALAGNDVAWFFEKGTGLPSKKRWKRPFQTTVGVKPGQDSVALTIPIVEGENHAADRNRWVGELKVSSTDIRRELPAGTEVEITMRIDASRVITLLAYIPMLDQEFECQVELRKKTKPLARLRADVTTEKQRLDSLREKAEAAGEGSLVDTLDDIESSELLESIEAELDAAQNDPDAAEKCDKMLLEFQLKLDEIEGRVTWPALVGEAREALDDLQRVAERHGTEEDKKRARDLGKALERIIEDKRVEALKRQTGDIRDLWIEILFKVPAFWVGQFQWVQQRADDMSDRASANRLISAGHNYLANNNVRGLQQTVIQLYRLLPPEVVTEAQRGFGSILVQ